MAFASGSATPLAIGVSGTGSGVVSGSLGSNITIFCSTGQSSGCNATLTRGLYQTLTAVAASTSVFGGWTGDLSGQDPTNPTLTVEMDTGRNIGVEFDPVPAPPDNSGNWTWDPTANGGRGGWIWTGQGNPPSGGGNQPAGGCWHWDNIIGRGAWVHDICGGGGHPPGSTLPVEIVTSGDPNDKVGNPGVGSAQYFWDEAPKLLDLFR